jgi:hypothetical protein
MGQAPPSIVQSGLLIHWQISPPAFFWVESKSTRSPGWTM